MNLIFFAVTVLCSALVLILLARWFFFDDFDSSPRFVIHLKFFFIGTSPYYGDSSTVSIGWLDTIWNLNGQIQWHQHIIHFIWFTYSWTLINHLLTYLCFRLDRTRRQFSCPAHHLGTFSLSIFISNFQFQVGSYEPTIFNSSLALSLLTSGTNVFI